MEKKTKHSRFVQKKTREEKHYKYSKGITLVALVITIIVLIILAGISINLVLGENGLFYKAKQAAEKYQQAAIDEQKMTNDLEEGIEKIANDNRPKTIEEAKTTNYGYFYEKTTLTDSDGNKVVIPAGFKIADDSGDNVTAGIVIEDKDIIEGIGENRGNQYVWIPVSNINKDGSNPIIKSNSEGTTEEIEITLGRYEFADDSKTYTDNEGKDLGKLAKGTEILRQKAGDETETVINAYYKELKTYRDGKEFENTTGENRTAKDLAGFINSVKENGGYYIARYEASYGIDNKPNSKVSDNYSESSAPTQEGYLWNNITQISAAKACDNMYDTVSSDLVNSYAWDTAIVYIQNFSDNGTTYSMQNSKNTTSLANTGKRENDTTDKVCNIYDMASNCFEWTTECSAHTYNSIADPCVYRGDNYYYSDRYTSSRYYYYATYSNKGYTFRPILYIK